MKAFRFRYATRYAWRYVTVEAMTEGQAREITAAKVRIDPLFLTLIWERDAQEGAQGSR